LDASAFDIGTIAFGNKKEDSWKRVLTTTMVSYFPKVNARSVKLRS